MVGTQEIRLLGPPACLTLLPPSPQAAWEAAESPQQQCLLSCQSLRAEDTPLGVSSSPKTALVPGTAAPKEKGLVLGCSPSSAPPLGQLRCCTRQGASSWDSHIHCMRLASP